MVASDGARLQLQLQYNRIEYYVSKEFIELGNKMELGLG